MSQYYFASLGVIAVSRFISGFRALPVPRHLRNPDHLVVQLFSYAFEKNLGLQLCTVWRLFAHKNCLPKCRDLLSRGILVAGLARRLLSRFRLPVALSPGPGSNHRGLIPGYDWQTFSRA